MSEQGKIIMWCLFPFIWVAGVWLRDWTYRNKKPPYD